MQEARQTLTVRDRASLCLDCVTAVEQFSAEKIRLKATGGVVIITGQRLKITAFSEGTGQFSCEGVVHSVAFQDKKEGLVKRIFK